MSRITPPDLRPRPFVAVMGHHADRACAAPSVIALLTSDDAKQNGLSPLMPSAVENPKTGTPFWFLLQSLLAEGIVRHVGEPIALIVAETIDLGLDALEPIEVDFKLLEVVTTPEAAWDPAALDLSDTVPGRLSGRAVR